MNENLCRICLTASEQELIELFNTETSYASKFTFCSGIEVCTTALGRVDLSLY